MQQCLDILDVLNEGTLLKLTETMKKNNKSCFEMSENVNFLVKQGLIESKIIQKRRKAYAITQLGMTVLEGIKDLKKPLSKMSEKGFKAENQKTTFVLIPNSIVNVNT